MLKIKTCPSCYRTFSDLSLSFCLNDGALLSAPVESEEYQRRLFELDAEGESEIETVVYHSEDVIEPSLDVSLDRWSVSFGENFEVSFERTLRVPDDGDNYPLPPSLGSFPMYRVADFRDSVPESWVAHGGIFIPMYQREALWLNFSGVHWRPNAVKVATGKINAVTGSTWNQRITSDQQDYMVCPPQEWIDGFKTEDGIVRQFVAMPLGLGYSIEEQVTGNAEFGGIQIIVFDPKAGIFPDEEPFVDEDGEDDEELFVDDDNVILRSVPAPSGFEMGIAAGGKIEQKIYPDPHGADVWNERCYGRLFVHIVNSEMFKLITGLEAPTTPISPHTYTEHGFPWFKVYDENMADLPVQNGLASVKPVIAVDKSKGPFFDDDSISISDGQVKKIPMKNPIEDGEW